MKKYFGWLLVLGACASYQKRRDCEKVNWFQHGFDVAMSGKRLTGDTTLLECRKVEAKIDEGQLDVGFKSGMQKYCQPDVVLALGKRGELFSTELCFANQHEKLRAQHTEGVRQFCQKSNGYTAGTSGYVYNQICPEKLEKSFLPEYRRGRKKFLANRIEEQTRKRGEIDDAVEKAQSSKRFLEFERAALANSHRIRVTERVFDSSKGQYVDVDRWQEDPVIESRRWNLTTQISQKDAEIRSLRKEQGLVSGQISEDRIELQGLEN